MHWRLSHLHFPVFNLGPGKRIGVWVQGCGIKCQECINKSLWDETAGKEINIASLSKFIVDFQSNYDGITITGGEPFDQYEALISFSAYLKLKTKLNICVFSGYYLNELLRKFPDRLFIKYLDYLIDGPFLFDQYDDENTRGSKNQHIFQFNEGNIMPANFNIVPGSWSINLHGDNKVFLTGIPKKNELEMLSENLNQSGISIRFN